MLEVDVCGHFVVGHFAGEVGEVGEAAEDLADDFAERTADVDIGNVLAPLVALGALDIVPVNSLVLDCDQVLDNLVVFGCGVGSSVAFVVIVQDVAAPALTERVAIVTVIDSPEPY